MLATTSNYNVECVTTDSAVCLDRLGGHDGLGLQRYVACHLVLPVGVDHLLGLVQVVQVAGWSTSYNPTNLFWCSD